MNHDEYTDYSCSTSVERLARDVETVLRSWHLEGSDRHVSFSMCREQQDVVRPTTTKTTTAVTDIQMIRSEPIQWIVNLNDGGKVVVPLLLTLWDGPSRTPSDDEVLAQSLRRLPLSQIPHDPFANLSTLFGIGQHLTLSLTPGTKSSSDLLWALGGSIVQRHSEDLSPWAVTASLAGLLQTALHCATSNIECRIPSFGLWGVYSPDQHHKRIPSWLQSMPEPSSLFPSWMLTSKEIPLRRRTSLFQRSTHLQRRFLPPILRANLLDEHSFWVSVLPFQSASSSRLTVWGQLLMKHCQDETIVLSAARHVYKWKKSTSFPRANLLFVNSGSAEWRAWSQVLIDPKESEESVESYRSLCQTYALTLLEQALGASAAEPMWGSPDDPISSVEASVIWNGKPVDDGSVEPLLSFPLKIRSRRSMSRADWIDVEESVESAILNPLLSTSFAVRANYDKETSASTLAASQRCLLATLIRTATLPSNVLIFHLTQEAVMDQWNTDALDRSVAHVVNLANVSAITRQLVDAMDWPSVADDMIEPWQAERILHQIFDGGLYLGFPSAPEGVFAMDAGVVDTEHGMNKSAPPGRLVSLLFLQMTRLRAPSSMALLWVSFIAELRHYWDARECLPNMGHVPGLDPSPERLTKNQGFSTIGLKADCAAFVHSSEPDPDDSYCLIGQKLQVFNLGVECAVAMEIRDIELMERRANSVAPFQPAHDEVDDDCGVSVATTEIATNETLRPANTNRKTTALFSDDPVRVKPCIVDALPFPQRTIEIVEEERSIFSCSTNRMEFYDAMEGSISGFVSRNVQGDHTINVAQRQGRRGARCPVLGATLIASGDQLYAPYLQRPFPLTDDLILERRMILSTENNTEQSSSTNFQSRIHIAQRLQKPKLLSDMRAFKAANPGAIFQDFINWYGNPGNPLEEYNEQESLLSLNASVAVKLDKASQAIHILNVIREFWSATWDEASACAAMDQEPLFDVMNAVEMVLDNLGTMHPASLMNQVLAVNLSASYFVLVSSAGEAKFLGVIDTSLARLKAQTNFALEMLSRDVVHGGLSDKDLPDDRLPRYASLETIRACEAVCNAIGEIEVLTCRALSLLHKFPHQYDLVERMLRREDSDPIPLDSQDGGRQEILARIAKEQQGDVATPVLREYILRNTDDARPSQLCVRFGQDDVEGGLMIAMTKSHASVS